MAKRKYKNIYKYRYARMFHDEHPELFCITVDKHIDRRGPPGYEDEVQVVELIDGAYYLIRHERFCDMVYEFLTKQEVVFSRAEAISLRDYFKPARTTSEPRPRIFGDRMETFNEEVYVRPKETSREEAACMDFIQRYAIKTPNIWNDYSSYNYKHRVEEICGFYISSQQFRDSAIALGFKYKDYADAKLNFKLSKRAAAEVTMRCTARALNDRDLDSYKIVERLGEEKSFKEMIGRFI